MYIIDPRMRVTKRKLDHTANRYALINSMYYGLHQFSNLLSSELWLRANGRSLWNKNVVPGTLFNSYLADNRPTLMQLQLSSLIFTSCIHLSWPSIRVYCMQNIIPLITSQLSLSSCPHAQSFNSALVQLAVLVRRATLSLVERVQQCLVLKLPWSITTEYYFAVRHLSCPCWLNSDESSADMSAKYTLHKKKTLTSGFQNPHSLWTSTPQALLLRSRDCRN